MALAVFKKPELNSTTLAAIRLIRTSGIGVQTYHELVSEYGAPEKALEALPNIAKARKRNIDIYPLEAAEADASAKSASASVPPDPYEAPR